ncbi:MAG: bifunctional methylenetetrahydrofolate dehydrogenase/methenyltetrahydrofolate cyclohydrolase FolD [Ignavibacteria bacterium]|jgi:methylenetetrahydrofolate dehydrogenase (NADP+)/methenyltetrahydrofolate cyclohydrolase|nr:bifunctional methylenetetrahydrofolate dehydrogenase/methenyltetrahydrofolate cyclohydrolase FolD [Ignavibacteria bacterium]MDH7527596.1 bifunctional methylenetetrahydrofolate dehydrogenase/methenyltetrahydrofolate cyclohydrolase FolD [Ignavibacteria bacterium]
MKAQILDGKNTAALIRNRIKEIIEKDFKPRNFQPGLIAIIVGKNPASKIYVNSKAKACQEVGIFSKVIELEESTSQNDLVDLIKQLNINPKYHGILVQQPLPPHINTQFVNESIDPDKDVDGFHPVNMGKLLLGEECFVPCTPLGIIELLKHYKIDLSGKDVVIIGRSNIVGKPLAAMLMQKNKFTNATVTICHSATKDISFYTKNADIVIAAIGKAEFLKADMIKENAIVIDVGINRVEDLNSEKGYRIVGDVKFDEVSEKASYITPVPGGVGPMTIAMLLKNTLIASSKYYGLEVNV